MNLELGIDEWENWEIRIRVFAVFWMCRRELLLVERFCGECRSDLKNMWN